MLTARSVSRLDSADRAGTNTAIIGNSSQGVTWAARVRRALFCSSYCDAYHKRHPRKRNLQGGYSPMNERDRTMSVARMSSGTCKLLIVVSLHLSCIVASNDSIPAAADSVDRRPSHPDEAANSSGARPRSASATTKFPRFFSLGRLCQSIWQHA